MEVSTQFRIQKLFGFHRHYIELKLKKQMLEILWLLQVYADIGVGETVCNTGKEEALPIINE